MPRMPRKSALRLPYLPYASMLDRLATHLVLSVDKPAKQNHQQQVHDNLVSLSELVAVVTAESGDDGGGNVS